VFYGTEISPTVFTKTRYYATGTLLGKVSPVKTPTDSFFKLSLICQYIGIVYYIILRLGLGFPIAFYSLGFPTVTLYVFLIYHGRPFTILLSLLMGDEMAGRKTDIK
jgi:hypothetical protein